MLKICLVFWKSEPRYAYKRYAYKKKHVFQIEPVLQIGQTLLQKTFQVLKIGPTLLKKVPVS